MQKQILTAFTLALALGSLSSGAQSTNPQEVPGTPPTFPSDTKPGQTGPDPRLPSDPSSMPPDTKAPAASSRQVQQQIEQALSKEPDLESSDIKVMVDKKTVTLTGTVDDAKDRTMALRIAQSYASDRQVVDKLKLKG
jgi:hypothetical protein